MLASSVMKKKIARKITSERVEWEFFTKVGMIINTSDEQKKRISNAKEKGSIKLTM
jgi:hypothetical protein